MPRFVLTSLSTFFVMAICLTGVSALLGLPKVAHAQSAGVEYKSVVEEIVVTARRRSESLQETPISITAMTARDLEARNLTNLVEVGRFAPNVQMNVSPGGSGGGSNAQIYIRGIGQTDFLFTTDPGVGIYVDGVFHPRTLGGVMDLLDLERIEILRGPQGTLFGKNTIGGAVSLTSSKPTGEYGGSVSVTVGDYNRVDTRLSLDLPIVADTLAAKVALVAKRRDGYATRRDFATGRKTAEQGDEDAQSARLALRWTPSDVTTVDFVADYTKENEDSAPTTLVQFEPSAGLAGLWNALVGAPSGSTMGTQFIARDPYDTFATGPNDNQLEAWGMALTVEHDFESMTLKSITAYREMDATFGRDGDGSPNQYVHTEQDQLQDQFSQEFQLSGSAFDDKMNWMVGAFYFEEFGRDENDVRLASGLFDALEGLPAALICLGPGGTPPCAGGVGNPVNAALDLDFNIFNEIDITSFAFYTHTTYDITDRWSINAGIRYSDEEKDYTLEHLRVNSGVPIVPFTVISDDWNAFSPKLGVDFQVTDQVMTYASVSRGFKSGGFNGRPTVAAEVDAFDPEFVTTYEVGAKSELFDRRLRLNGSVFFNDYTDIQIGSVSADATGNLVLIVDNAAEAEVWGVELEFVAQVNERLSFSGGIGYLDAQYKDVGNATNITESSEFVKSPDVTASLSMEYAHPLSDWGTLAWRIDGSYSAEVFQDVQNTASISQDALTLVSARIVFESASQGWEASLFATNLTDEEFIVNGLQALASFGTAEAVYGAPRQWGASVKVSF
ncbi:MAG: TonB-dependent receptor [Gammaproteobacteria bacterium]|nr:TonB-dependent receptor [Gammaproteobacteria bacterium]